MTSRFSTSASRAQHTPKVCISKRVEANKVSIPTWQRALVTIDMPADDAIERPAIYQTTWITRSGPDLNWNYNEPISAIYRLALTIAADITFTNNDIDLRVFPVAPSPGHPPRQYRAVCPQSAWSHTLYGGRTPIVDGANQQHGVLSIRFDGQNQTQT